jgi:hypothetical protein
MIDTYQDWHWIQDEPLYDDPEYIELYDYDWEEMYEELCT